MLSLEQPSQSILEEHYTLLKNAVLKALSMSPLNSAGKDYIEENLRAILTDTPEKLRAHHYKLMSYLEKNIIDIPEFEKIKRKPKKEEKLKIYNKYITSYNQVNEIFDYSNFISGKKNISYKIAEWKGTMTCTYCNRNYSNIIITQNNKKLSRPQFDHWYPQSKFPSLALSFYNLIPCCNICNSTFKGDNILNDKYFHPYFTEEGETFSFSFFKKSLNENTVKIKAKKNSKILRNLSVFQIQEVYDSHSTTVLKDLLDLRYRYSDNYLDILFNQTFNLRVGKEQAYRLVFGVEPKEEDFHKKPFSKFKFDILRELGVRLGK